MATAKFKEASPYVQPKPSPPVEDYLYSKYIEDLSLKTDSRDDPILKVALFGVGRAGTIHLTTIVSNARVKLLYIVDDVETNWRNMKKHWHLNDVSVLADANIPEIGAIDDFDTVAVVMQFPSGTLGMIDLSRNSNYGYDQRLEVFGPKGMVRADNEQPIHSVRSQCGLHGITAPSIWYSFASRFMNGYRREFDHFVDVVHGRDQSKVKSKEILAVSKIATACEESVRKGKVVDLNWTPDELPDNQ